MEPLSDLFIGNLLRTNEQGILFQREDDQVEFKAIFDNGSKEAKAKYAKELAALYNCKGGYLIFGVDDKTNKLVGLEGFIEPDNADLSIVINGYFSPAIPFKTLVKVIDEKKVFIIYVPQRELTPTICQKNHQAILTKSTIYWRYSGQAAPIEPGDLQNLLNEIRGEESKKQTEILEKEYRLKLKPRLELRGGMTSGSDGTFYRNLYNKGEDGIIESVKLTEGSHEFTLYKVSEIPFKKDRQVKIEGRSFNVHPDQMDFQLLIEYRDEEGHRYESDMIWNRGKCSITETREL